MLIIIIIIIIIIIKLYLYSTFHTKQCSSKCLTTNKLCAQRNYMHSDPHKNRHKIHIKTLNIIIQTGIKYITKN